MTKRSREDADTIFPSKRIRTSSHDFDRLSLLSDELLLRTLSYLSVSDLVLCQRLSRRLHALAGDPQLWKGLFYNRFVRPRASRIPGVRDHETSSKSLFYSSKISKWLDDDHLVRGTKTTNWKRQYKLRHNWSRGSANVSEMQVAEKATKPPLLVRLHGETIVIVDATSGLRAWSLKGNACLLASIAINASGPTSLAIDATEDMTNEINVSVGFEDGSFAIYTLSKGERKFVMRHKHSPSTNGAIHAIAYATPYLLTMTDEPLLSLYEMEINPKEIIGETLRPPRLLSSLRSHTAYPPTSLAIRKSSATVIASIAYAMPTWTTGWSVGLQEVRLTGEGTIVDSRTASASAAFLPTTAAQKVVSDDSGLGQWDITSNRQKLNLQRMPSITKPTSLSYKHPYLLAAHADNTLTLYMVTSNADELSIGAGQRLWGHTSSVSGAQVGDRGKAVSVSALGNEVRVWELEGGLSSNTSRRRAVTGETSVQVRSENGVSKNHSSLHGMRPAEVFNAVRSATAVDQVEISKHARGWVAFDEEKVVLLKEKMQGAQAVVVYDFG